MIIVNAIILHVPGSVLEPGSHSNNPLFLPPVQHLRAYPIVWVDISSCLTPFSFSNLGV
jgi:hypothetical protein